MELITEIIIAAAVCAASFAVLLSLWRALLTPVRRREDAEAVAAVVAKSDAEGLEQTVRELVYLRDSGRADVRIVIVDRGLTADARRRAEILARKNSAELTDDKTK